MECCHSCQDHLLLLPELWSFPQNCQNDPFPDPAGSPFHSEQKPYRGLIMSGLPNSPMTVSLLHPIALRARQPPALPWALVLPGLCWKRSFLTFSMAFCLSFLKTLLNCQPSRWGFAWPLTINGSTAPPWCSSFPCQGFHMAFTI